MLARFECVSVRCRRVSSRSFVGVLVLGDRSLDDDLVITTVQGTNQLVTYAIANGW